MLKTAGVLVAPGTSGALPDSPLALAQFPSLLPVMEHAVALVEFHVIVTELPKVILAAEG
jgi:hypothetical protein